jgi:hypothetical protein
LILALRKFTLAGMSIIDSYLLRAAYCGMASNGRAERDAKIYARRIEGFSFQAIANEFKLTRETGATNRQTHGAQSQVARARCQAWRDQLRPPQLAASKAQEAQDERAALLVSLIPVGWLFFSVVYLKRQA